MLFLTLNTFSKTGGIEKVCRIAAKAFDNIARIMNRDLYLFSLHDLHDASSEPYVRKKNLHAFEGHRVAFVLKAVARGLRCKTIIISHVNLALPAYIIKILSPKTKIIVMAHGIEVWKPMKGVKKKLLEKADLVIAVSDFTKQQINQLYTLKRAAIINNCIDPYFPEAPGIPKPAMREKLGFCIKDFVLLTVSRLTSKEFNKNFDKIFSAMKALKPQTPNLKYLLVGKYDSSEKARLEALATRLGLAKDVVFTGYIPDDELPAYYGAADLYAMPSKKEGFGITFIEAMYYGLPVIGGHRDGSIDALLNGRLGLLVDPDRQEEITSAIAKIYCNADSFKPDRKLVLDNFGFETYQNKWLRVLQEN